MTTPLRNQILLIIAIGMLYVLTTDCIRLFYSHFSENDLEWVVNMTSNYPQAVFLSNKGNKSELLYTEIECYDDEDDRFYISEDSGCTTPSEAVEYYYFDVNQPDFSFSGNLLLTKKYHGGYLEMISSIGLDECMRFTEDIYGNAEIPVEEQAFKIGDRIFYHCIIIDDRNSSYRQGSNLNNGTGIKKYVISKEYGLIYYEFESGEYFVRQFD